MSRHILIGAPAVAIGIANQILGTHGHETRENFFHASPLRAFYPARWLESDCTDKSTVATCNLQPQRTPRSARDCFKVSFLLHAAENRAGRQAPSLRLRACKRTRALWFDRAQV
jgi:hypothetical protein